ncbi:hypothetical protein GCM10022384_01970 [Streptomyces marokkonensis]|uniref:ATPase dynein-related AAA domain-containing protein n=1 Tax=Streptomyces marokkonensis TaxID=324855 RepID=A0ABP7NQ79_9ACTN
MVGDPDAGISRKFVGSPSLVERALVTLATNRGLMLVGEPGTAKSLLSELIAAAVSGTSTLTVQGGADTTEDQIKYSWNYALLVSEDPSRRSLVPAPMLRGMAEGRIVRPRVEAESMRVLAVAEAGPVRYDAAAQRLEAVLHDPAGNEALLSTAHNPHCPGILDALADALASGTADRISGSLRHDRGRVLLAPLAVRTSHGVLVPDLAPGDGDTALRVAPPPPGTTPSPPPWNRPSPPSPRPPTTA